jgi:hypothetical protein
MAKKIVAAAQQFSGVWRHEVEELREFAPPPAHEGALLKELSRFAGWAGGRLQFAESEVPVDFRFSVGFCFCFGFAFMTLIADASRFVLMWAA